MKRSRKFLRLVFSLAFVVCMARGKEVHAQLFRTLHSFNGTNGMDPRGGLLLADKRLYGVTTSGGTGGYGVVFAMNTDGSGFTVLHDFTAISDPTNYDGANPLGRLILSGNALYGTTQLGGEGGTGTIFAVNTDGTGFMTVHSFTRSSPNSIGNYTNSDGASPSAGLVLCGGTLYGTASVGGIWGRGTVFALKTNGLEFTTLHSFTTENVPPGTNLDGAMPSGDLFLVGKTLYGTAQNGGESGWGTIFAINTDGADFETLHSFTFNSEGAYPSAGLVFSGSTLYGTAAHGGFSGYGSSVYGLGTVFAIKTNGTGFAVLHMFPTNATDFNIIDSLTRTNSDGARPSASLSLLGNTLYGTADGGGSSSYGTVFAVNTDGTSFKVLHTFTDLRDGIHPLTAGLIMSDNTLYGTAGGGGSWNAGIVFSITLPVPKLDVYLSGPNVVTLSWPTNYLGFDFAGFRLQSTTNLASGVWTSNLPAPVLFNSYYITIPISGQEHFFRLVP